MKKSQTVLLAIGSLVAVSLTSCSEENRYPAVPEVVQTQNPSPEKSIPSQVLPDYGALTGVLDPDVELFRQYQTIFFFSLDDSDVNERLGDTDWEKMEGPVAASWNFQVFSQFPKEEPGIVFGPSSSVVFSFTGRNKVTREPRTLAWAVLKDENSAGLLNAVFGGGNSVGEISMQIVDDGQDLIFRGLVRTEYGLNMHARATLPKDVPQVIVENDPHVLKISFVDWSTVPPTVHEPFIQARQYYQTVFSNATSGFGAKLNAVGVYFHIPGDGIWSGFDDIKSVYNRTNQFVVLQAD
jgi:hypothetical protein